jgi:FecR protein/LysM domain
MKRISFAAALALPLGLALALAPRSASADDVVRYEVKKGDTCASIAQQFYGDSRMVEPIHRANEMTSPPPHSLKQGQILVIPPRPSSAPRGPDATLSEVRNRVEIRAPEARPGKVDDPLFRGNRVATDEVSAAAVTFRDETQVHLGERTLVVILGDARMAASKASTETNLVTGSLRAFMQSASARAAIKTDAAQVRVVEGEAKVSADTKKATRLAVYNGNSTITAVSVKREVPKGFGSKAELGKAPTVPRPLPPAPEWTSLPAGMLFDRGTGAPSFVAEFDAPQGAKVTSFRVQVARDASFADPVVDRIVSREVRRFEAHAQGPGRHFVRVAAVDDDGFEGPYGRPASFGVIQVARTAEGDAEVVNVDPSTMFCVRVGNVPMQRVAGPFRVGRGEPVLLRCALTEDSLTTLVRVD